MHPPRFLRSGDTIGYGLYTAMLRTGHLFAGAGGGLLADLILGHRPVFAVEWNDYAAECLRTRTADGWFPGLRVHHGDVRMFDPSEYAGRVDILHAGFPCQDISVAGSGAGIGGERSGLWAEVVRIAGELRPGELFLENSPAITSRGLGRVLGDLAELGYDARWCVLPASAVGAPHIRARWWCLARRADNNGARQLQPEGSQPAQRGWIGVMGEDVADTDQERGKGRPRPQWQSRRPEPENCGAVPDTASQQHQGQPHAGSRQGKGQGIPELRDYWAAEPGLGRVADGVANRAHRIKALGNGQVPLQAAAAYVLLSSGIGPQRPCADAPLKAASAGTTG